MNCHRNLSLRRSRNRSQSWRAERSEERSLELIWSREKILIVFFNKVCDGRFSFSRSYLKLFSTESFKTTFFSFFILIGVLSCQAKKGFNRSKGLVPPDSKETKPFDLSPSGPLGHRFCLGLPSFELEGRIGERMLRRAGRCYGWLATG